MRALIIFCMSFWRTLSSIDIQIIDVTDDAEVVTKSSRCSLLLPKAKEEISFMGLIPSRSTVRIEMSTKWLLHQREVIRLVIHSSSVTFIRFGPRWKTFRYSCLLPSWILFYFGRIHQSWMNDHEAMYSYPELELTRLTQDLYASSNNCINFSKISTTFIFPLQKDNYIPITITMYWKKRNEE